MGGNYTVKAQRYDKVGKKFCTVCRIAKELTEFYKDVRMPDGYRNQCIPCRSKIDQNRNAGNTRKKNIVVPVPGWGFICNFDLFILIKLKAKPKFIASESFIEKGNLI